MFKSLSTSLIARGILALAVGVIALAWPGVTVLALVIMFAVYALTAAALQAARAFASRDAGPVAGHLLLALADLAAGAVALAWPAPTALVLVLIVGTWAIIAGLAEVAAAFGAGQPAGAGALTLALLFALFNLTTGTWMLAHGIQLRHTGNTLHLEREKALA